MTEEYVVGEPKPPWWVKKGLSAYRKTDGSVGYEYMDGRAYYRLDRGDILTNDNGRVRRRKGEDHERDESISE
jgi:hypothetical protein